MVAQFVVRSGNSPEEAEKVTDGSFMAQAVSRRRLAVEAQIRCQASPYGIFSAKSGTQIGFPSQYNSTNHLSVIGTA